jgi:hypothetical protein
MMCADPACHFAPQNDQLIPKDRIFRFKPLPRLEWQGDNSQEEAEQR